jgi:hypothetical protein
MALTIVLLALLSVVYYWLVVNSTVVYQSSCVDSLLHPEVYISAITNISLNGLRVVLLTIN